MDRMLNSKSEKESIYEIYRACRLCGGGAGYKMPIIQNIVDLDEADVELKQKIRDCVQIEVHQDDKMPPLICELCVDKVNDFYEFLEMCRQTNKRTRLRLGLPPQSLSRGAPDAGDCILGLTEPVFVNEDSDGEPLAKHKKLNKTKIKKEPVVRIKVENLQDERLNRHKTKRPPTPPRVTRHSRSKDDDVTLSVQPPKPSKMAPKSILKKENNVKNDSSSNLSSRLKRSRDKEPVKLDTPTKKVKITIKPPPPPSRPKLSPKVSPRLSPKSSPRLNTKINTLRSTRSPPAMVPSKRPTSPTRETFLCTICGLQNKTSQARGNHMRSHTVSFTNAKLACNPCGEWFHTLDESASHQKSHRSKNIPYNCRRCQADFKRLGEFDEHLEKNECLPYTEVPDVKCEVCWHLFPTNNLLDQHKCLGEDYRPGGKCSKCHRRYTILKNLKKHQSVCAAKKKGDFIINKKLLSKVRPIQIRVARCDPLLSNVKQEHYDVSTVSADYGLDSNCYYPYIGGLKIKSEFPGMVDIQDEVKNEFCSEDYVHWDSEDSDNDEDISCNAILNPTPKKRTAESLAALTLKTIFSQRFLGKVPKKKRKLKVEKVFDSMLCDDDERMDISGIIDNLRDDCEKNYDSSLNLSQDTSNVSSDKVNDSADDGVNDNVKANDSLTVDVNESTNDGANDSKVVDDNDSTNDGLDNVTANDSVVDINDSNSDVLNDDVYDSSSQLSNNTDAKADVVSSNNRNTLDLNKIVDNLPDTNSIDTIKNNDNSMDVSSNNDQVISNKEFDENALENDSQDSNSQSLLDIDFLKSNDSVFTNIGGKNDLGNSDQSNDVNLTKNDHLTTNKETANFESVSKNIDSYNTDSKNIDSYNTDSKNIDSYNTDSKNTDSYNTDSKNTDSYNTDSKNIDSYNTDSKNIDSYNTDSKNIDSYNTDSKNIDLEINNANFNNDNLEFRIHKNVQSNDSVYSNDSRYPNDTINRSILDEIDAQINDSNISNRNISDNDSNNDKIVLEDLLSKSTDSKIGLGSIEDYSFDS